MFKIYPKLSAQAFGNEFEEIIKESDGIEIQFFDENGITSPFNFEDEIRNKKSLYSNLKEIVIHPPLSNYNIELIFFKDENIFRNQIIKMAELSKELCIDISMVYHTYWPVRQFVSTGLIDRIRNQVKLIEGTNVTILIENLFMMLDEKDECSALEVCKLLDHPNIRCCIDTTHLHCKANIYKSDFLEMVNKELNPIDCERYVKQVHFAAALDNDGYIDKKRTHGRKHNDFESLKEEFEWLKRMGMKEKHYITEVSEEDYYARADQIEEINMLKIVAK